MTDNSYTIVYQTRIYGVVKGYLTKGEVVDMVITPSAMLHEVRHMQNLSKKSREKMVGLEFEKNLEKHKIDEKLIEECLKTAGSKFNAKIEDLDLLFKFLREVLLERVHTGEGFPWIENPATGNKTVRIEYVLDADHKKKLGLSSSELLGTAPVIEITPDIEKRVTRAPRGAGETKDKLEVNIVSGIMPPETDNLFIVLRHVKGGDKISFGSAYSGSTGPYIPEKGSMSEEAYAYSKEWWDRHAFVR